MVQSGRVGGMKGGSDWLVQLGRVEGMAGVGGSVRKDGSDGWSGWVSQEGWEGWKEGVSGWFS